MTGDCTLTILQKLGQASANIESRRRADEFVMLALARLAAKGDAGLALSFANHHRMPQRVCEVLKTAVAGDTTSSADALADFGPLAQAFSGTLANVSAFDAILADAVQVPLHRQFAVSISDASAAAVGEGSAKKLTSLTLGSHTLQERKAAALVVASDDLLKFGAAGALALLENSLRTGVAAATNSVFLAAMIAAGTPIGSSGTGPANVLHDLRLLADAAGSGGNSKFHLVVGAAVARRLALMSAGTTGVQAFPEMTTGGGSVAGIPTHVDDSLSTAAVLVDASALAASADPVRIRISPSASIEMTDSPTMSIATGSPPAPEGPAGSPPAGVVSMFQVDATAVICERVYGFDLMRTTAAQSLAGIAWGLTGSPPA